MKNKELWLIGGVSAGVITAVTAGTLYIIKKRNKKKKEERLNEDLEILEASLENKNWWLTKECQTRSKEIIVWVKEEAKNEEIEEALEVIKKKHWMTNDYRNAFRTIYDWAKTKREKV